MRTTRLPPGSATYSAWSGPRSSPVPGRHARRRLCVRRRRGRQWRAGVRWGMPNGSAFDELPIAEVAVPAARRARVVVEAAAHVQDRWLERDGRWLARIARHDAPA